MLLPDDTRFPSFGDNPVAFDFNSDGHPDHLLIYRTAADYPPQVGIFKNDGGRFSNAMTTTTLKTFSVSDTIFSAYDYNGSGKLDHILVYGPGTGSIWISKGLGSSTTPVFTSTTGIGSFGLNDDRDRIVSFDLASTGVASTLVCYRPEGGSFAIFRNLDAEAAAPAAVLATHAREAALAKDRENEANWRANATAKDTADASVARLQGDIQRIQSERNTTQDRALTLDHDLRTMTGLRDVEVQKVTDEKKKVKDLENAKTTLEGDLKKTTGERDAEIRKVNDEKKKVKDLDDDVKRLKAERDAEVLRRTTAEGKVTTLEAEKKKWENPVKPVVQPVVKPSPMAVNVSERRNPFTLTLKAGYTYNMAFGFGSCAEATLNCTVHINGDRTFYWARYPTYFVFQDLDRMESVPYNVPAAVLPSSTVDRKCEISLQMNGWAYERSRSDMMAANISNVTYNQDTGTTRIETLNTPGAQGRTTMAFTIVAK
jgi:hypothetical protein